jgi:CubicO group peptidase (beta-lactamase class C family)
MSPFVKLALAMTCGMALSLAASGGGAQVTAPLVQARPAATPPAASPPAPRPVRAATPATVALPPAPQSGPRLAPGAPIPPAELEAFVDGVVLQAMAHDHIAGVAVSVVQGGQVVLKKGYGFAGPNRPVDPDATLFRLGSISKTFTWIALMKESEAGRIRPATPINLYLPESLQVKDQGFKQPILVRDLMNHDAGFADRTLGQLFEQDPRRVRPLALYLRQERPRRVREPGVLPSYSNYGAALAGEAVAWVNGRPFPDIVEAEITRPLQMAHTTFREPYPPRADLPAPMPAAQAAQVSTAYRWAAGDFQPQGFEYVSQIAPAGAASSTAGDMARYMLMILGGGQLDGVSVYGADTARGFRTASKVAAPGVNGLDDGFLEFTLPAGLRGQGHGGDTLWFHSGMVTVPDLNLGVFVTTNTSTGSALADSLPGKIVGRFYAWPDPPAPRTPPPGQALERGVYDGTYLTTRRPYNGLEQFVFRLLGQARIRVAGDGRLLIAAADGVHAWVPTATSGVFARVDGPQTSAFRIENGRAVRWYAPSGVVAYDRVGLLRQTPTLALAAVLTALASIATVVGLFTRDRREFRQTPMQARAGQVQTAIAVLWLVAMVLFGVFAVQAGDLGYVMYAWPTPFLLIGSACALVAAILSGLTVLMAPAVWRGGRRVDSWNGWRKLRFSLSTLIFAGFSVLLALWGALEPWSG